jgi:hypothetical protein
MVLAWFGMGSASTSNSGMQSQRTMEDAMEKITLHVSTKIDGIEHENSGEWEYPQTIEEARETFGDRKLLTFALQYAKILREGELRAEIRKTLAGEQTSRSSAFKLKV